MQDAFHKVYGRAPRWAARAPGRVNLIGEHTDYNDGYVLPMALECDTTVLAAPVDSNTITLRSTAAEEVVKVDLAQPLKPQAKGHWANYPLGVIAGFLKAGHRLGGFDALVHSSVPIGGGLSSSAALEVATATLLEAIAGVRIDPVAKALLCQAAEHEYAGVPCGIMDQFISTLGQKGHLLLLDCRTREAEQIPFADPSLSVLIVNTTVKHSLAGGEYALRRSQCEMAAAQLGVSSLRDVTAGQLAQAHQTIDPVVFRRARHIIGEIERTLQAVERIRARDWPGLGDLMYRSHESLQRDFEVSCVELDLVVESARKIGRAGGVYGCRMTGGGFGGCAVALIDAAAEQAITRSLSADFTRLTGLTPVAFSSRPGQGTTLL